MTAQQAKGLLIESIMDLLDGYDIWPVITPADVNAHLHEVWDTISEELQT